MKPTAFGCAMFGAGPRYTVKFANDRLAPKPPPAVPPSQRSKFAEISQSMKRALV